MWKVPFCLWKDGKGWQGFFIHLVQNVAIYNKCGGQKCVFWNIMYGKRCALWNAQLGKVCIGKSGQGVHYVTHTLPRRCVMAKKKWKGPKCIQKTNTQHFRNVNEGPVSSKMLNRVTPCDLQRAFMGLIFGGHMRPFIVPWWTSKMLQTDYLVTLLWLKHIPKKKQISLFTK